MFVVKNLHDEIVSSDPFKLKEEEKTAHDKIISHDPTIHKQDEKEWSPVLGFYVDKTKT